MEPLKDLPKGQDMTKQERKSEAPKQDRDKLITEMLAYFGVQPNQTIISVYVGGLSSLSDEIVSTVIARAIITLKERPMIIDLLQMADKIVKVNIAANEKPGPTYMIQMKGHGAYCGNQYAEGEVIRTKNADVAQALERINSLFEERLNIEEKGEWNGANKLQVDPFNAGKLTV